MFTNNRQPISLSVIQLINQSTNKLFNYIQERSHHMIVADRKPVEEIIEYLKNHQSILILGCNECVTVCEAGGKKEVQVLASALRMHAQKEGKDLGWR